MNLKICITHICFCLSLILSNNLAYAKSELSVHDLHINFLLHPDKVFLNGYLADIKIQQIPGRNELFQFVEISQKKPFFGWKISSSNGNIIQSAYQVIVNKGAEVTWDSGKVANDNSTNIYYQGRPLESSSNYSWKVKIWDADGNESDFSDVQHFKTSTVLKDHATSTYPLQKADNFPETIKHLKKENIFFADFGKDAFGRLRLSLYSKENNKAITVNIGESIVNGRINKSPPGTIRFASYSLKLNRGWNTYNITIKPDKLNSSSSSILMPPYIGEVTPFRYVEIENYSEQIKKEQIIRETVSYPFDELDSEFSSSDEVLNQVWELSKYSIKATSFAGMYIDGDRERVPYEADTLINQLGQYSISNELALPRFSHEYLVKKATWPTEWIMQSILIAWNDYLYTGNKQSLETFYEDLKKKSLLSLADQSDNLLNTKKENMNNALMVSVNAQWPLGDLVDWPHPHETNKKGETDGFVFSEKNAVINAYHYKAISLLKEIAKILDHNDDYNFYSQRQKLVKQEYRKLFFNPSTGLYVDGIGTRHSSLHTNMFALAFGLVTETEKDKVVDFIRSRGMACSVYGAQFLLEGIYDTNDSEYGKKLLTATDKRSWYNMIKVGSTITMEAWDNQFKDNLDWNHAWGAAPANIIARKIMGIEPLEPGFSKIKIKPQPADLKYARMKHPSIRGDIHVSFEKKSSNRFLLSINIPSNSSAKVYLPKLSDNSQTYQNGSLIRGLIEENFIIFDHIGSGSHTFEVVR
ncbi:MAG TPA: alpha-L-rhamnosidase C-terminal domain-containing protein [Cellvibrio sp.]|nr:alpha-L-rhamnosidase C-terminal domain-containing protein [Cellvibrio sp.]